MTDLSFQRLPYSYARKNGIAVLAIEPDKVIVMLRADATAASIAEARRALGRPLQVEHLTEDDFNERLTRFYGSGNGTASAIVDDIASGMDLSRLLQDIPRVEDLLETQDDAPVIRLINALLTQALRDGASDVHIEPYETQSAVRLRVDGVLRDILRPAKSLHAALVSRVKIMAQLDIAEKRLPQDGRITLRIAGRQVDVRVSTIPAVHGERVVLRLLDKQAGRLDLTQLGMSDDTLAAMDRLIAMPHGILLMTGPTGSGKTTTLYAALSRLDAATRNIMTVEDPVEYELPGISQTQINNRIDMSFARALRAILRQDPDVIMIGEIRDLETAQIAVQASLTGHLVLATLHTNDAVAAVTRLVDMGVEPFLLASSLIGVGAQRLVRKLCPECRRPGAFSSEQLKEWGAGVSARELYSASGCATCNNTGYRGRTGIYELLVVDDVLRGLVHEHGAEPSMREYASRRGMRTLREDGLRWVRDGTTSLEEVARVTRDGI